MVSRGEFISSILQSRRIPIHDLIKSVSPEFGQLSRTAVVIDLWPIHQPQKPIRSLSCTSHANIQYYAGTRTRLFVGVSMPHKSSVT